MPNTSLKISVGKLSIENPIMVASGVCGFGEENREVLNKCGAVVFKTLTLYPKKGNPPPRVVDFPYGMLNSIGLENPGVKGVKEKLKYIKKIKTKKIASFLAEEEKDFFYILEELEKLEVFDGYEINLSCPNVEKGRWFYDIKILEQIFKKLRKMTKKPLIAKISIENDIKKIIKILKDNNFDGVCMLNTFRAIAVDYKKISFKLATVYGGYSGAAIKPLVQRYIYDVKKEFGDIDIIATGGIMNPSDVVEYILLGAKAVQIGSAYFRNPQLPVECIKFLNNYLKEKNLKLTELIGMLK
ncbi:MAG: dihydroorotate dehydrogenase [Elusimicrobiota bacterium]|nr:dihydroorotate dehydrogenase [Endomicrobiia bacterium]MDW8165539.1 dihydroorotate dehydrogenase [Elusimicrobiota bacterium]